MTDTADADLDSTCAGCGNPLQDGATCEAGCSDRGTPAAEGGAAGPSGHQVPDPA